MNMWHSIQTPITKWDFVAEFHRSFLNNVMDKNVLKGGGNNGNDIVCNKLFEMRIVNGQKIIKLIRDLDNGIGIVL